MAFTRNDSIAAETYWARRLGIPEAWAHADAQVESGHDPYAIGDHGSSFGDYQLHVGGLLGSHTREWAFNPLNNAGVALQHFAATARAHPGVQDPGVLFALSQRPADPRGYAVKVDAALQTGPAGELAGWGGFHAPSNPFNSPLPGEHLFDKTAGAVVEPFVAFYKLIVSGKTWIRVGLFAGGFVLIVIGAKAAFSDGGPTIVPVPV